VKAFLLAIVFFVSFTDAFSLGPWLKLWVIFTLAVIPLTLISVFRVGRISVSCYKGEDLLILLLFLALVISSFFRPSPLSLNYLFAYFFIFIICYLYLKGVFHNFISPRQLLKANFVGVYFVTFFVLLDFFCWFLLHIDLQEFIPRTRDPSAVYMRLFRRSYGFATEPTILAFYFNTLGVMAVWYAWYRLPIARHLRFFLVSLAFFAWLTTFSAVAFVALPVSFLISVVVTKFWNPFINYKVVMVFFCSVVITSAFMLLTLDDDSLHYVLPLYEKVTLQQVGEGARPERWMNDVQIISERPFLGQGLGFASSSGRGSSVNWYLFLTMEGGLISSVPIMLFIFVSYLRIASKKIPGQIWFMSAFLAGSIHLFAISAFFHPFLWFLLILYFVYSEKFDVNFSKKESA